MNKLNIPKIGLGTWEISGHDLKVSLEAALKEGYKLIDTAQIYNNEAEIGEIIKNHKRSDLFITSKVWVDNYLNHVEESVNESLRRLKTDYIDLMLVHVFYKDRKITINAFKHLLDLKKTGKIKHVGVSNWDKEDIEEAHKLFGVYPEVNQIVITPTHQQREYRHWLKSKGIAVTGYSILRDYVKNPSQLKEATATLTDHQRAQIDAIGKKHNKTGSQVLLKWALQEDVLIIPKSKSPQRVKENFELDDFELTKEEMHIIEKMDRNSGDNGQESKKFINGWVFPDFEKGLLFKTKYRRSSLIARYLKNKVTHKK